MRFLQFVIWMSRVLDPVFWSFVISDDLLEMEHKDGMPWWWNCCPSQWVADLIAWLWADEKGK